jgi:hypothetical protein
VWQLSASPVLDKTLNPGRTDMYGLDRPEVVMVFASIAPSALAGSDLPVSVLVDSTFNDPVVSRAAVAALLEAGIGVGAMREISAREAQATIIAADPDSAEALAALLDGALGTVETKDWPAKVVGLDAAITLGADFVASVRDK